MLERSARLLAIANLRHGFSTRLGGTSIDFGADKAEAEAARARFLAALGEEDALALAEVDQVHGATVLELSAPQRGGVEADGMTSAARGLALAIRTADCAPVLIAALDGRGNAEAVAAVHAGWRGAVADIPGIAVAQLRDRGARHLVAAIGPTIGADDFEVGDEVIAAAESVLAGPVKKHRGPRDRWHLDLVALVESLLLRAGVAEVERVGGSTVADAARYHSYRREQGRSGRHLSAIALV
ncbi:MAG: polyphenol oxidase family protein [Myxococcota bacterium]